jgi:hypothetical protein
MSRIKERSRRKAALSDRKSAAAQARMKSIATLAADDRVPKKKRKAGTGKSSRLGTFAPCDLRPNRGHLWS